MTMEKKNKLALLLTLAKIVVGNQLLLTNFRFFFDCISVSFGASNDLRKGFLKQLGIGTTANRKVILDRICSMKASPTAPCWGMADNCQMFLNKNGSYVVMDHKLAVHGLSALCEPIDVSKYTNDQYTIPTFTPDEIDEKISAKFYTGNAKEKFNAIGQDQFIIVQKLYAKEVNLINNKWKEMNGIPVERSEKRGKKRKRESVSMMASQTPHSAIHNTDALNTPVTRRARNIDRKISSNSDTASPTIAFTLTSSPSSRTPHNAKPNPTINTTTTTSTTTTSTTTTSTTTTSTTTTTTTSYANNNVATHRGIIASTFEGNISSTDGLDATMDRWLSQMTDEIEFDETKLAEIANRQQVMLSMDGKLFVDFLSHKKRLLRIAETELENDILTSFEKYVKYEQCAAVPGDLHFIFHFLSFLYFIFYGNILECLKYACKRYTIGNTAKDVIDSYREHRDLFLIAGRAALYAMLSKNKNLTFETCTPFVKHYLFFRALLRGARNGNAKLWYQAMPYCFMCFASLGEKKSTYRHITSVCIENAELFFSDFAKIEWLHNRFMKLVNVYVARDTFVEFFNWLQKKYRIATKEQFFSVANAAWTLYVMRSSFSSDSLVQQTVHNTMISDGRRGDLALFYHLFTTTDNINNLWPVVEKYVSNFGVDAETPEPEAVKMNREMCIVLNRPLTEENLWKGVKRTNQSGGTNLPAIRKRKQSNVEYLNFESKDFKKSLKQHVKLRKFRIKNEMKQKINTMQSYKDYLQRKSLGEIDAVAQESISTAANSFLQHFHGDDSFNNALRAILLKD
jgi:hypothetical protein